MGRSGEQRWARQGLWQPPQGGRRERVGQQQGARATCSRRAAAAALKRAIVCCTTPRATAGKLPSRAKRKSKLAARNAAAPNAAGISV